MKICIDKRLSRGELCSCQLSEREPLNQEAPQTLAGSIPTHSTIGSLGSSVWTGVCEGGLRRSAVGLKTSSEGEIDVAIAWPLTLRSEGPEA